MNLEMINKRIKIIDDLVREINKIKTLYEESLNDNTEIQKIQEKEEEIKKIKEEAKLKKQKVEESPNLKAMRDQMNELRNEMKDNKEALSQELADYYRETGSNEITDVEGNTKRIKFSAKLVNS